MVVKHNSGCQILSLSAFVKFIGIFLMVLGVGVTLIPMKMQNYFVAIMIQVVSFVVLVIFFTQSGYFDAFDLSVPDEVKHVTTSNYLKALLALLLSVCFAIVAGFLFKMYLRLGPTFMGLVCGFILGAFFITVVNDLADLLSGQQNSDIFSFFWIMIIVVLFTLIGTLLGFRYSYVVIIVTKSLLSAYMFVRGLSLWVGGYPSEVELFSKVFNEDDMDLG